MQPGTLVRIKKSSIDADVVAEHGTLWIVTRLWLRAPDVGSLLRSPGVIGVYARALATGNEHYWYHHEIEEEPDAQEG